MRSAASEEHLALLFGARRLWPLTRTLRVHHLDGGIRLNMRRQFAKAGQSKPGRLDIIGLHLSHGTMLARAAHVRPGSLTPTSSSAAPGVLAFTEWVTHREA